jgi:3-oxoisoapionate decarboxylase
MRIGIDSYCYHRFFGEHYPQQAPAPYLMSLEDFLERARHWGAEGVSLESCYIADRSPSDLAPIGRWLDRHTMDRVWAWGHLNGLEGGAGRAAFDEMLRNFEHARAIGARVMRVVGSSRRIIEPPREEQIHLITEMFRQAVPTAERYGIRMALENHRDFNARQILWLMQQVDSPWLGVNFDTGNALRLGDDPIEALQMLAPYVCAVHLKDMQRHPTAEPSEWFYYSSVPAGEGMVDIPKALEILKGAGFDGLLAVELDFLHPDHGEDEDAAVGRSLRHLRTVLGDGSVV